MDKEEEAKHYAAIADKERPWRSTGWIRLCISLTLVVARVERCIDGDGPENDVMGSVTGLDGLGWTRRWEACLRGCYFFILFS